ncbi:MAG: hypothetical protein JO155_07275 [Acidimicrobiia bacterium]|nr:hypothetical protein [Acidimicrobiia bacterium]
MAPATTVRATGPQNLPATDALRAQLVTAYVAFTHFPARDIAGTQPGSVFYAYLPSTRTYWAVATFEPRAAAAFQTLVNMQDGGDIGIFSRPTGAAWKMQGVGGIPFPCSARLLPELQRLWGLQSPEGCLS